MAKDLRTFLESAGANVLRVSRPVQREHLSALIVEARQPVLFEQIEGFDGWRLADLLFRDRAAQAIVLGTEPDAVLPFLAERLSRPPTAPRLITRRPGAWIDHDGGDADFGLLPGFQHGTRDPGPSLIAMVVCQGPDGGPANFSFTRISPFDAQRATYLIGSSPHMRSILDAWEARGEAMPIAFVIGTHPAYEIMASYSVPEHLERFGELDMVANLVDEQVELVACRTVPLAVPAHAEVVIEGRVASGERRDDGPGPSQALYYIPGVTRQPVVEISSISIRENPILRQHNTLMYSDHQPLLSLPHEAMLYERLTKQGFRVREVAYVPWGGTLACVVQMTPASEGEAHNALMLMLGERWPSARLAIAIDDDVDIESAEDLIWSVATRVEPTRDIFVVPSAKGHALDPTAREAAGGPRNVVTGKWAIDATGPPASDPPARARFERTVPPHAGKVRLADFL